MTTIRNRVTQGSFFDLWGWGRGLVYLLPVLVLGCEPSSQHVRSGGVDPSPPPAQAVPVPASGNQTLHLIARAATRTYHDPDSFSIEVVFENHGSSPVRIFPAALYRHYRPVHEETVAFVPSNSESGSFDPFERV